MKIADGVAVDESRAEGDLPFNHPKGATEIEDRRVKDYQQLLLKEGLIREIPPPIHDLKPYYGFQPIQVQGKPLPETIIEERR